MWSILNLLTAILGFVVFGVLLFSPRQNRFVNLFLGGSFVVIAYRSLSIYLVTEGIVDNTFLMGYVSFAYYFIPTGVYLYVRSVVYDEQSLKKSDWIHFLVPSLSVLLLVYYIVSSYIVNRRIKLHVNQGIFNNITDFAIYVQPGYHALLIFALCAIYTALSWQLVYKKLRKKSGEHPQIQKIRTWVLTLLITFSILLIVLFLGVILKLVLNIDLTFNFNVDIIRSIVLLYIFTRVLFKTDLLYGIPNLKTQLPVIDNLPTSIDNDNLNDNSNKIIIEEVETNDIEGLQESSLFFDEFGWIHFENLNDLNKGEHNPPSNTIEKDKVVNYIIRINKYLATEPYTNVDFDIKFISKELQAPLYHIEYLFRYYNKYSFSEFRNLMRVNYVVKKLESGTSQNYTIEAIGLNAGFNSRSSFFRVFKAVTGKTPKQAIESE